MAVILGVLVAAGFGTGDFLGGRASRDAPAVGVLFVAQVTALVLAVVAAVAVAGHADGRSLAFGAVAGVFNAAGLGALYRGLATGRMGVVAPVTAIVAAVIPVGWGLATGERPAAVVLVGVVVAIAAGALVGCEPDFPDEAPTADARTALWLALAGGTAFGVSFVCLAETRSGSGFWPILAERIAATVVIGAAVLIATRLRHGSVLPRDHPRPLAVAAGVLDVGSTLLLLLAVRRGLLSVVAPLAALAPAATVVWAWTLLKEPVTRLQLVGLGASVVGLALIALG